MYYSHHKRVLLFGSVSAVSVGALIAILLIANYISYRHYWRNDLTKNKLYTISDKTKNIIKNLNDPVDVYVLFPRTSRLFSYISFTLDEMKRFSSKLNVKYIDIDHDFLKVQQLAKKFKLSDEEYIVISQNERFRVLTRNDIAEYDYGNSMYGQEPVLIGFKGEQAVLSAILSVNDRQRTKIYFTRGHGEHNINDYKDDLGYDKAKNLLMRHNYIVENILLADLNKIPQDADLLVVGGAKQPFIMHEINLINDYLDGNKPLLLLFDPQSSPRLDKILARFNVEAGNDVVVDPSQCVPFGSAAYLLCNLQSNHLITKPLKNMTGMFFIASSVSVRDKNNADIKFSVLAQTTKDGWGETDIDSENLEKNESVDLMGPVSIAAAVENQAGNRLVVFGDSDFITNSQIGNLANADLFANSVNWLLQQETKISVGPKLFDKHTVAISAKDMRKLSIIVVFILPLLSLSIGIAVWRIRRK
ncbi:GldG family protein [bacterium]|nr:GldG family protein [bacterium]